MENVCRFIEIFSSAACFDHWLNRYQTLIIGIIAGWVAWRQVGITQSQNKMIRKQNEMSNAIKLLEFDAFLEEIFKFMGHMTSGSPQREAVGINAFGGLSGDNPQAFDEHGFPVTKLSHWDLPYIDKIDDRFNEERLLLITAELFPKYVSDVRSTLRAYEDVKKFWQLWKTEPWDTLYLSNQEADAAMVRFMGFGGRLYPLRSDVRDQRDPNDRFVELRKTA